MMKRSWIVAAAVLCWAGLGLAGSAWAQGDSKLSPENPGTATPFDENHLDGYTTGMLISLVETLQNGDADAQHRAAAIASYLSQHDANWRVSMSQQLNVGKTSTGILHRRIKKSDDGDKTTKFASVEPPPAPTTPASVASVAPAPTTPPATTTPVATYEPTPSPFPIATGPSRRDWFSVAEQQMREFWEADRDVPGAAPRGMIYDPATGKLVKLTDHTTAVGVGQSFSDELANTSSGGAGTMKRIKDQ